MNVRLGTSPTVMPVEPSSITQLFDSPNDRVSLSPPSIDYGSVDEGAGVFSSAASRQRCLDAVLEPGHGTNCDARKIFPADGTSRALAAFPCLVTELSPVFLLGEEIVMIDDAPTRTPCTGGPAALCPDHRPVRIDAARVIVIDVDSLLPLKIAMY